MVFAFNGTHAQENRTWWIDIGSIVIATLGILGNILVCVIFTWFSRNRTITTQFLVSLALADLATDVLLLFSSIPLPRMSKEAWIYLGEIYCRVWLPQSLLWVCIGASALNLTLVTVERYYFLCRPGRYDKLFTKTRAKIYIFLTWLVAVLISLFNFLVWRENAYGECVLLYSSKDILHMLIGIMIFTTEYLLPVITMITVYAKIMYDMKARASALTKASTRGSSSPALSLLRARAKVVKILFIVVIAFTVSWAPNQVMFLFYSLGVPFARDYLDSVAYGILLLMGFCNSCVNPVIYAFKMKQFQDGCKEFLLWARKPYLRSDVHDIPSDCGKCNGTEI